VPTHQHVVAAVRDRDPAAAEAAMRGLLDQSDSDVSRTLRERAAPADDAGLDGTA
jgi:DNA-binding GntR family transcriptional regulator